MEHDASVRVEVVPSIHAIDAAAWDTVAGDDNPFIEHAFLAALEDGGSVGERAGWVPQFLVVRGPAPHRETAPDGPAPHRETAAGGEAVLAAAPMYAKGNSYGEYIFDWGWASAARRSGLPYYPKLTAAVPFTPATGPRLLVHPALDPRPLRQALGQAALALAEHLGASGVHWLFCEDDEAEALAGVGYARRRTYQFHWMNPGYRDFDDFLSTFRRKRRKEVRRERRKASSHGLDIEVVAGPDLTGDDWDGLYTFYRSTVAMRGGMPYLTRETWDRFAQGPVAERVVAVLAREGRKPVAGTLNFRKGRHLYGRYWGALDDYDCLHFEACYYRLIEYAIDHRLTRFEAGAQGQHKLARGLLPHVTHSAHRLLHEGFHDAVADFCQREAAEVRREMAWQLESSPFQDVRTG